MPRYGIPGPESDSCLLFLPEMMLSSKPAIQAATQETYLQASSLFKFKKCFLPACN